MPYISGCSTFRNLQVSAVTHNNAALAGGIVNRKSMWMLMIGVAVVLMFLGLVMLASVPFQDGGGNNNILPWASFVFSGGALATGAGMFVRARDIEEKSRPTRGVAQARQELLRANGICSVCKKEPAMIRCTLHTAKVCATCLTTHDSAWCEYVPCTRKSTAVGKGAWR